MSVSNREFLLWYHGRVSRDVANQTLLNQNGHRDGTYLIRDCSSMPGDYVLSLWCRNQVMHYQVHCLGDNRFAIDDGPIFHGLDSLTAHYKVNPDGLPCQLTDFCPGKIAPLHSVKYGMDTRLHIACRERNLNVVHQLIGDPIIKSNVNARSMSGHTALHIACSKGDDQVVKLLLSAGADTSALDSNGKTPIQIVCSFDHASTLHLLITQGHADFHDRCAYNGWVPLHEVAMRGFVDCAKVLLSFNASMYPRTVDGDTPRDLALRYGNYEIVEFFDNYPDSIPKTSPGQWLHEGLDRNAASSLLQKAGLDDGVFLIRSSIKCHGYYVLTVAFEKKVYHFQIKSRADRWFYIDDGPLFETLPHLVDHYMLYADGLPILLSRPVSAYDKFPHKRAPAPLPTGKLLKLPSPPSVVRPQLIPASADLTKQHSSDGDSDSFARLGTESQPHATSRPPPPLPTMKSLPAPPSQSSPKPSVSKKVTQQTMIPRESLKLGQELGVGEFGSVLKGIWTNPSGQKINVALKTLHKDKLQQGEKEFLREARVMSQLNHSCIVCLLGVCLGPPMILVQELVAMGALLDHLIDFQREISEVDLKLWAAQIAWGMMYLEQKRFVHRDLATRNILLANQNQVKISDFGLSRAVGTGSDYYQAQEGGRWPLKWYAPESINFGTFSQKSDVWSYGVTLWEMFTFGELPYGEMTGTEVITLLERGGRLEQPEGCPTHTYQIMLKCWHIDPTKRPTFKELHTIFSTDPEYEDARKYRDKLKK